MKTTSKRNKFHVKKGDIVEVISGADAGSKKTGKVLQVLTQKSTAIVEGLNLVKKCMRKTQDNPQGGIVEKEASIAISNLRVLDEASAKNRKTSKASK